MRLHDVMTKNVHTIDISAAPEDAWDLMKQQKVRHLVVLDGKLIAGIISERDLGGANGEDVRQNRTLEELMINNLVTASPTTTVREAANLMRGNTVGCLPVLDGDTLVGIVTTTDLLELIGRGIKRVVMDTDRPILTNTDEARSKKPRYDATALRHRSGGRRR